MATKCSVMTDYMVHMKSHRSHHDADVRHKRSAVELLEATKGTYVKSTVVLNHKQELKHPENLSVGNRELISLPISLCRHSPIDEPLRITREHNLENSDDSTKGTQASLQSTNNHRSSPQTFTGSNGGSPTLATKITEHTDDVSAKIQTGSKLPCSNVIVSYSSALPSEINSASTTNHSKNSVENGALKGPYYLPKPTPTNKPVVAPKPGSAIKPITSPKAGSKSTITSPTGIPASPLCSQSTYRTSHPSSYDVTDSTITMATSDQKLLNDKTSGSTDQSIRFCSVSTSAFQSVNSSKDCGDSNSSKDKNLPASTTSVTASHKSRHSLCFHEEGRLKALSDNFLSTSVGVLVDAEKAPVPKPCDDKQLSDELPPQRQLHRSQSDLSSCRHSRTSSDYSDLSSRISRTSTEVERFFNEMGIDHLVLKPMRKLSETKQKECLDSLSSLDSVEGNTASSEISSNMDRLPMESEQDLSQRDAGTTSVVERNARIIKWLCNVRKASLVPTKPELKRPDGT